MDENNRIIKFSIDEKTSICGKEEADDFIEKLEKDGFSVKDFLLGEFDMDDDDDEEDGDDFDDEEGDDFDDEEGDESDDEGEDEHEEGLTQEVIDLILEIIRNR
jgi:hypothetical protein